MKASPRVAIAVTLVIAIALGTASSVAILSAARRRAALSDEIAASLPQVPGARLVAPWQPAADADEAHATYCLDDMDAAAGASRFMAALTGAGWKIDKVTHHDAPTRSVTFEAAGGGYRLRAATRPDKRPDCTAAKRQVAVMIDAARAR